MFGNRRYLEAGLTLPDFIRKLFTRVFVLALKCGLSFSVSAVRPKGVPRSCVQDSHNAVDTCHWDVHPMAEYHDTYIIGYGDDLPFMHFGGILRNSGICLDKGS